MTAPADAYGPVPMRWEMVRPGDVIVGKDRMLMVTGAGPDGARWRLDVASGYDLARTLYGKADNIAPVLVLLIERDAVLALREAGLGPQLLERVS